MEEEWCFYEVLVCVCVCWFICRSQAGQVFLLVQCCELSIQYSMCGFCFFWTFSADKLLSNASLQVYCVGSCAKAKSKISMTIMKCEMSLFLKLWTHLHNACYLCLVHLHRICFLWSSKQKWAFIFTSTQSFCNATGAKHQELKECDIEQGRHWGI